MVAEIHIKLDESSQIALDGFIGRLLEQTSNVPGALKTVGEALLQTTRERFERQTDPDGKPWQPLSALTVRLRGSNGPILRRSGRLLSSVSYGVVGNRLELGPNTVDAAVHQFGATIVPREKKALRIPGRKGANSDIWAKKVTIPARPYIGFGALDQQAAEEALEDWFAVEGD